MNREVRILKFTFFGLVLGLSPILLLPRGSVVLLINQHRTPISDAVMPLITYAGSVWTFIPFVIYYFMKSRRKAYALLIAIALHGVVAYLLKHVIFNNVTRPVVFFEEQGIHTINFIEGVDYHRYFSFPSGHTTTAFTMIMLLCLIYKRMWATFLGIIIAAAIGFSRIYLLQHFFGDVYAGMVLGGICALVVYQWYTSKVVLDSRHTKP